jgi:hypothetical protein
MRVPQRREGSQKFTNFSLLTAESETQVDRQALGWLRDEIRIGKRPIEFWQRCARETARAVLPHRANSDDQEIAEAIGGRGAS